jgi:pyruvate/2-oxoglutarate dehydrogenase complex dihydrolipoamide acyltransferase (E2) component
MLRAGERVTGWRRVAGAMWHPPDDPQIFGALDIDATSLLVFIEQERARGHRITPTHLVGRAIAHALEKVPDLNVRISHGRMVPREAIEIFFITAVEHGRDLSGIKIANVDRMRAYEVGEELSRRSAALKGGHDAEFSRSKRLMDALPPWLLRRALRWTAFVTEELGLDAPALGLRRSPFGSAMVTSVGMFGIPQGFAPLAWMYDVPLLVLVGELTPKPVAIDGRVEVRSMLPITATIDHRYADGWHISRAMAAFREYLADPRGFEGIQGASGSM